MGVKKRRRRKRKVERVGTRETMERAEGWDGTAQRRKEKIERKGITGYKARKGVRKERKTERKR